MHEYKSCPNVEYDHAGRLCSDSEVAALDHVNPHDHTSQIGSGQLTSAAHSLIDQCNQATVLMMRRIEAVRGVKCSSCCARWPLDHAHCILLQRT